MEAYSARTDTSYLLEEYKRRRKVVLEGIRSIPGLSVNGIDAAFYALVNISSTGLDSRTFARELLARHHVAVVPALAYGNDFDGFVRIAFTVSVPVLGQAIERMRAFMEELHARR